MAPTSRAPTLDTLFAARARTSRATSRWPEEPEGAISLAYGFAAPERFPTDALVAATAEVLAEDAPHALNYGPTYPGLVRLIIDRLAHQQISAGPSNIMVTHGSSQALGLLAQVFIDQGDTVIVEGPSFMGAVNYFIAAGARLVTVPVGAEGLDLDVLEGTLADLKAEGVVPKFVYTIPTYHNPTGTLMPLANRQRLIELAVRYGTLLLEDDAYGELYFDAPPPPRLAALDTDGVVIHVSTFSKILAPGVRVGFACARPEIIERLSMFKIEGGNGPFITRVVERYCADGRLEAHIADLRRLYKRKAEVMLAAIEREFLPEVTFRRPAGGFFIWCRLPDGMDAPTLLKAAEARGVSFVAGSDFYANGAGANELRLAFSLQSEELIVKGIERTGAAMRSLVG
ncbi:MAG TPA: PLP-dependent aminotransferase family protein [Roseiflexaceae bacterium]|nr:PLP-dependent aminotransferase family protein [Roseiflexaceae bacterium]